MSEARSDRLQRLKQQYGSGELPNTGSGETEAQPPAQAMQPVKPTTIPSSSHEDAPYEDDPYSHDPNDPHDPLEKLLTRGIGGQKGRQLAKDKMDSMSDGEAKERLKQTLGVSKEEAIGTLNDVNGGWPVSYWVTMEQLKKLGYDVPEIPPIQKPASGNWEEADFTNAPRWIKTTNLKGKLDGGYERGYWSKKKVINPITKQKEEIVVSNGGAHDGPYVTINKSEPHSVQVEDPRHIRKILRAVHAKVGGGSKIDSAGYEAHTAAVQARDAGMTDMDRRAGIEGEERSRHANLRPKAAKPKKLGGKPTLDSMQGRGSDIEDDKRKSQHSLKSRLQEPKRTPSEPVVGRSSKLANKIKSILDDKFSMLDQIADVTGSDSDAWRAEEAKIRNWAREILATKAAAIKGTEIWDELLSVAEDVNEWNDMNEWMTYNDILEHIYE